MFNHEQLAAIAAAMSVLQHSLRSDSPTDSLDPLTNNNTIDISHNNHLPHHHHHSQQHHNHHLHHEHADQVVTSDLTNGLQSVAGLRALAQLEWQQQQQQQALINHYNQLQQSNNELHYLAPSPPKQQQQQQPPLQPSPALVNHHQHLANHYQPQLQQQSELHLSSSPLKHHALVNNHHYQPSLLQQTDLHHLTPTPPKQQQPPPISQPPQQQLLQLRPKQQSPQTPQQQQQSQLQSQQLQQQAQQQVLAPNKPNRPESYSAIVAKLWLNQQNQVPVQPNHHHHQQQQPQQQITPQQQPLQSQQPPAQLQHKLLPTQQLQPQLQLQNNHQQHIINASQQQQQLSTNSPSYGSATNLLGFMGLYVGNLSPDLTKEQLEKIFSKYGEPVKAHRLIRSPVAFIKYENTESPRAAIDDLYGVLLPELTLNQDQPLKLHFDRNDAQLKANYRPTELPLKNDNGECYGWRTTVCRRGKNCPKKHIPINRGIDFQMWMIKSTPTTTS